MQLNDNLICTMHSYFSGKNIDVENLPFFSSIWVVKRPLRQKTWRAEECAMTHGVTDQDKHKTF